MLLFSGKPLQLLPEFLVGVPASQSTQTNYEWYRRLSATTVEEVNQGTSPGNFMVRLG